MFTATNDRQITYLRLSLSPACSRLQTMEAVLIYAGLQREELLWLMADDVILSHRGSSCPSMMSRVQVKTINDQHWQPKSKRSRKETIVHSPIKRNLILRRGLLTECVKLFISFTVHIKVIYKVFFINFVCVFLSQPVNHIGQQLQIVIFLHSIWLDPKRIPNNTNSGT